MIDLKQGLTKPQRVRLDWRAYWKEFSRMHGDSPVKYRGRLLFRDGWAYSATAYEGPEWPPEEDLTLFSRMVKAYWVLRKREIRQLWWEAQVELDGLKKLASVKSIPLQQTLSMTGDDGKLYRSSGDVSIGELEQSVSFLRQQLRECEENLNVAEDVRSV